MRFNDFCFHEPEEIAEIEGVNYFCADKNGVSAFKGDAVINLTGHANIPKLNIPELDKHTDIPYKEIVVAWPDFGVPNLKPTFWPALHSYILSKGWKNVCVHCEGGHGRTGTAMAAILISTGELSMVESVEYVRSVYCEKAIETPDQCEYLRWLDEALNGRVIDDKDVPISSMEARKNKKEPTEKLVGLRYDVEG